MFPKIKKEIKKAIMFIQGKNYKLYVTVTHERGMTLI